MAIGNLGARPRYVARTFSLNQRQSLIPRWASPHPTLYALHKISRKPEVPYGEPYRPWLYRDPACRHTPCYVWHGSRGIPQRVRKSVFTQRTSEKTSGLQPGVYCTQRILRSSRGSASVGVCFAHSVFHTDWFRRPAVSNLNSLLG